MSKARFPGGPRGSLLTGERRAAFWLAVLADEGVDLSVRERIAECAASLWRGLGRETDPGLRERIYASLHQVSQRAGVRVLESGEVVPLGAVREEESGQSGTGRTRP